LYCKEKLLFFCVDPLVKQKRSTYKIRINMQFSDRKSIFRVLQRPFDSAKR